MPDSPFAAWKKITLQALGTVLIACTTVLLTRYGLGAESWQETIARLPLWGLVLLIASIPAAWIFIEFVGAFLRELVVLARAGGKSLAKTLARVPEALRNVLARFWDRLMGCFTRGSFDGRYRQRLYEDYGLFNDRGLGLINANRLDLEKVYVELQIGSAHTIATRMDLLRHPVEGRHTIWNFLAAVQPGRGLALIGAPGSGKTTLLQHLLLVFARNRQGRFRLRRLLPLLIELRHLREALEKKKPPTLAEAVRSYWKRSSRIADLMRREPAGWLESRLRSGRVLILLDGLDEVPQAQRKAISQWVQQQLRDENHRRCRFILTSRPAGYEEAPLPDATVLEVQPFSPPQTSQFINCWYLANEIVASGHKDDHSVRRRANQEANDLRKRLGENADLHDLTVNPLLLTMVCMVHRYHGALPGSRSQLYGEICQVLLERWRQAKGIPDELNGEQKLAVLRPLAQEFMKRELRDLAEAEIIQIIAAPLASVGFRQNGETAAAPQFLRSIQATSGLLLEKEKERWSFAHKTFQEYLTAEHWLRTSELKPDWPGMAPSAWWRETLLLYAARTDASELVEAALAEASTTSWGLAYQCLSEAQSLRPQVREHAESILRRALRSELPEVFRPAATALHHLRQRQTRRLTDQVEQRVTLVTQAEYQLFLAGLDPGDRQWLVPSHWTKQRFSGDPEAPVLGVSPTQASAFAAWATRGAGLNDWRLALPQESVELLAPGAAWWRDDGTISAVGEDVRQVIEECLNAHSSFVTHGPISMEDLINNSAHTLTRALALTRALVLAVVLYRPRVVGRERQRARARERGPIHVRDRDRDRVRALVRALVRARFRVLARLRGRDRDRDRDLEIGLEIGLALARDFARDFDLDFALDLARDLARDFDRDFDRDFVRELARDLARDFARDRDRDSARDSVRELDHAIDHALDCALDCAFHRGRVLALDGVLSLPRDYVLVSEITRVAPARNRALRYVRHAVDSALSSAIAIAHELDRDFAGELDIRLLHYFVSNLGSPVSFGSVDDSRLVELRKKAEAMQSTAVGIRDTTMANTAQLLICLLDVLTLESDYALQRRVWSSCAICLLEIVRCQLSKKNLSNLPAIDYDFLFMRARERGEIPPFEGILLVRDLTPP